MILLQLSRVIWLIAVIRLLLQFSSKSKIEGKASKVGVGGEVGGVMKE